MADFAFDSFSPSSSEQCNSSKMAQMKVMPQFGNFSTTSLQIVNLRLTEENYQYQRTQALVTVDAHGLEDHLKGLIQCPSPFIFTQNDSKIGTMKQSNPQYLIWKRCDKLLMSQLLASISESMFDNVAKCATACEVWRAIQAYFVTGS